MKGKNGIVPGKRQHVNIIRIMYQMAGRTHGSTTVSAFLGDGRIEKVESIRSGTSSRILAKTSDPSPEPVPPPKLYIGEEDVGVVFDRNNQLAYLDELELGKWSNGISSVLSQLRE